MPDTNLNLFVSSFTRKKEKKKTMKEMNPAITRRRTNQEEDRK